MSNPTKRLNFFERYLSLSVLVCMVVGLALGKGLPAVVTALSRLEFGAGSQVNVPIAVLIWLGPGDGARDLTDRRSAQRTVH